MLPDLDDEWVAEATEFETVDELLEDTRSRLSESREEQTRIAVRANLGRSWPSSSTRSRPRRWCPAEMQARLQNLAYNLQGRGIRLEDYLQITGRDPESLHRRAQARPPRRRSRSTWPCAPWPSAEGLDATDEELDEEIVHLIGDADIDRRGRHRGAAERRPALGGTLGHLEAQGAGVAGRPTARSSTRTATRSPAELLELPDEPEHDHDGHDHDHDHDHEVTITTTTTDPTLPGATECPPPRR